MDVQRAADAAFDAQVVADRLLDDEDLWLWSDVRIRTRRNEVGDVIGDPITDALDPAFKLALALPVYSAALGLWMAGLRLHTAGDRAQVVAHYGAALERHITAVSTRWDWRDDGTAPSTFAEQIRSRLSCRPVAHDRYARNGRCTFSIWCSSEIERTSVSIRDLTLEIGGGSSVLCTIDPSVAVQDEQVFEEEHRGIRS